MAIVCVLGGTLLGGLGGGFLPRVARAAGPYDPSLTWNTIFSPRFAVHYHDGARNLGVRVSRIAEEVLDGVGELFGYVPDGRIEIVLSDFSDWANGSAQVWPKNIVRLYLTAPTELTGLAGYDDWLRILLVHELAHVCDLDQTWGLTRLLRFIFGKYIAMNSFTPQFLSEGVAVYAETLLTPTGRGRSSFVDMILRMAALHGSFLSIDQAHIKYSDWPGATAAYFYGGRFHLWLHEHYGPDAVRALHRFTAANPIPYLFYLSGKSAFGESLPSLWGKWRQDEVAWAREIEAMVVAQGETRSRRITHHGRNITGALYSPDAKYIIYSRTSPVDGSTVRRVGRDGKGDRHLVLQTFSPRFSFAPDGKSFVFSQNATNARFHNYSDLLRYDIEKDEVKTLRPVESGAGPLRSRDPDISSDGKRIVFVQNALHQTWLSVGTYVDEERDRLRVRQLVGPRGDVQHASPRFSPDGKRIAVSTWFPGGKRDILILDANDGSLLRRVTYDTALDGNPAWSPDGRYLLYESDADGIFNIYAFDTLEARYARLTRVVGGAFQPDVSADGRWLLFRNGSGIGFDIHEIPYDPSAWEWQTYDPAAGYQRESAATAPSPQPLPPWAHEGFAGRAVPRAHEPLLALRPGEREEAYSPWRTLLPFQDNWILLPAVYVLNNDPSISLMTVGSDVLGEHTYMASIGTSQLTRHPNWKFIYANDTWYPTFALEYGDQALRYPTPERSRTTRLGVRLPMRARHNLGLSYAHERRDARTLGGAVLGSKTFGYAQAGYTYSHARIYPYSVSPEHGKRAAFSLRWYNRAFGSAFDEVLLNLSGGLYLNNPLWPNHVLALRAVAALALGPEFEEKFHLGGAQGTSLLTVQTQRTHPLRGFGLADALTGTGLFAAYAEYRFPIWHVERGVWTVPVYFERLHVGLFAEAGNTFGRGDESGVRDMLDRLWKRMRGLRMGTGLELRADVSLGWAFPLTLRVGAAVPVVDHGKSVRRPGVVAYVGLGTSL